MAKQMSEQEYTKMAIENIEIHEDRYGNPFARIISHSGVSKYKVSFVEPKGKVPHAVSCECKGYQFRLHCSHMELVDGYYKELYRTFAPSIYARQFPAPVVETTPADDKEALAEEIDALLKDLEAECDAIVAELEASEPTASPTVALSEEISAVEHLVEQGLEGYSKNLGTNIRYLRYQVNFEKLNIKSRDPMVLKAALLAHRRQKLIRHYAGEKVFSVA